MAEWMAEAPDRQQKTNYNYHDGLITLKLNKRPNTIPKPTPDELYLSKWKRRHQNENIPSTLKQFQMFGIPSVHLVGLAGSSVVWGGFI